MRFRYKTIVLIASLGGCSQHSDPARYSVYFQSYSVDVDQQARETIQTAANFARTHSGLPVEVAGFAAQPDPKQDVDGLSVQRAEVVKQLLVHDGIEPNRITMAANGMTDPKPLPRLAVRRVDISFGPTTGTEPAVAGSGLK